MKNSQDTLLKLIRISLWGAEADVLSLPPDWSKVLRLARQQTLLGLVAEALPYLPNEFRPDLKTTEKLRSLAINICMTHSLLNRKLADLKTLLDVNGIDSVLFKGQGVALNYPNPLSRQCGDIDMYVGEKNFAKALVLLKPDTDESASDFRHLKHFDCEDEGVSLEIHRIAEIIPGRKRNRLFQEWTVRHLEGDEIYKAEIGGTVINLPPHQFNAVYIMNHAWHHFVSGGIGLRQLCDWTMFLHRYHKDIDQNVLKQDLKMFGLTDAWKILAGVAVDYLGLPAVECPLYSEEYASRAEMMMEVIWSEGNFGFHSEKSKPRPAGHFAGKFHSFSMSTRRKFRIFRLSPADVIQAWVRSFITGMRNLFVRVK